MPHEFTGTPKPEQPVRMLPNGPISRTQRYRRMKIAKELGVPIDQIPDRRGRHSNHARGADNGRWNAESRIISEHGYVKVRVGRNHPLADPNGYAYEHLIVWIAAGKAPPNPDELLHHVDGNKTDNRLYNLELKTRSDHAVCHNADRPRDLATGQFKAKE